MTDYHCENCEFFEDRSTDKLIDGYCKKYNQSLNFYDWWEKCDKCIEEGKMTELEYLKQQEEKNAEAALRENARLEAEVERLKAENAALRERLEKAVEPPKPFIEQDRDGYYRVYSSRISIIRYAKQYGVYGTIEAAEARLKELKGEEE